MAFLTHLLFFLSPTPGPPRTTTTTTQIYREGLQAMLEPPGSYLAYACMYITCCLIKLFTLATNTYEEQHRHIAGTRADLPCPVSITEYVRYDWFFFGEYVCVWLYSFR
jgi:hypothetical protein